MTRRQQHQRRDTLQKAERVPRLIGTKSHSGGCTMQLRSAQFQRVASLVIPQPSPFGSDSA